MEHRVSQKKSRKGIITLAAAGMFVSTVALAQNPHCVGDPTAEVDGDTVTIEGSVAGIGNTDETTGVAEVEAVATVECRNKGGKVVDAQEKTLTEQAIATVTETQNGRANVEATVEFDLDENPCPNPNWDPSIKELTIVSAILFIAVNGQPEAEVQCFPDEQTGELVCQCIEV